MPSADGSDGVDSGPPIEPGAHSLTRLDMLLVEGLIHVLIEKGVLTRNDALSIVETAAQVKRGALYEDLSNRGQVEAELTALRRLYHSFEAVPDGRGDLQANSDNIYRLRPPVHGDRPEFPRDD